MNEPIFTIQALDSRTRSIQAALEADSGGLALRINDYPLIRFVDDASAEGLENLPGGGCAMNIRASYCDENPCYEPLVTAALTLVADRCAKVNMIDIGALWGHTSFVAGAVTTKLDAHLFEANPLVSEVLKSNTALNSNEHASYQVHNLLIANRSEMTEVTFRHYTARYGNYEGGQNVSRFKVLRQNLKANLRSWITRERQAVYETKEMEVAKLDDWIAKNEFEPNLIKIDVEGSQHDILLGAENSLSRHRPILLVEFDEPDAANYIGKTNRDVVEFLEGLGYRCIWGDHRVKDAKLYEIDSQTNLPIEANSLGIFY